LLTLTSPQAVFINATILKLLTGLDFIWSSSTSVVFKVTQGPITWSGSNMQIWMQVAV